MTLCAVWKRKEGDTEELVFATDSRLTGGELWDSGIKLFRFPREDCLLCFCGETQRAYPLILHLVESIRYDRQLLNRHTDLHRLVEHLTALFTVLCEEIKNPPSGIDLEDLKTEVEFIFGGWSWEQRLLCCWKITYSKEALGFVHEAIHDLREQTIQFIGDHTENAYIEIRRQQGTLDFSPATSLDMEPLNVITQFSLNSATYPEIGGSLQVAKVYQSGTSEFFGVLWSLPTENSYHFLGRECKTDVRYLDPESKLIRTLEQWEAFKNAPKESELETDVEPSEP
jgi:hypothetical protein